MALRQGEGDLGGDDGMLTRHLERERAVTGEARHCTASGLSGEEGLAEDLVDESTVVLERGEDVARERLHQGNHEAAEDGRHAELTSPAGEEVSWGGER
jgi:hypothetical protein